MAEDASTQALTPFSTSKRGQLLLAAGVAALVAILVHAPRLDRPLEASQASAAASYQMLFNRNWDAAGFLALKGIPCVGVGGSTVVEREPYLHHPVLTYWLSYAAHCHFGQSEKALRFVPFLATVAAAAVTALLVSRMTTWRAGLLAGMAFPILPLAFAFGCMPNPEASVVLFLLLGFWFSERERETRSRGRRFALYLVFFIGCFIDWQVYFLFPALLLGEGLREKSERRFRTVLTLFPLGVLAFALTLAHFAWALGSLSDLEEHILGTVQRTLSGGAERELGELFRNQREIVSYYVGWPTLAAILVLLGAAFTRPRWLRTLKGRILLPLCIPFLCNQGFFRTPAFDHHFYWMPLLVALPAALCIFLLEVERRAPLAFVLSALVLSASVVWLDVKHEERAFRSKSSAQDFRTVALLVDRFANPDDVVLTCEPLGPAMFYAKTKLYDGVETVDSLSRILDRPRHWKKLYFFAHVESEDRFRGLIAFCDAKGTRIPHNKVLCFDLSDAQLDAAERAKISK